MAVFLAVSPAIADSPGGTDGPGPHPLHDPSLRAAVELMLSMQLDSAETLVDGWIGEHPGRPAGLFFRAALLSWRLFLMPREADSGPLKQRFETAVRECRKSAERAAGRRETEFEGTVYLGAVYGQEALLAMLDRRYLVMAPLARRAWDHIQRAVSLDPEYFDSYFGLGIYLYFTDVLPKLVRVLAVAYGFEGDRARGLANLEMAANNGIYSNDAARIMLVNIFSEMEDPDSSIADMARNLYERFPGNPLIHWRYGDILLRLDRFVEAGEIFRGVLDRIGRDHPYYRNGMFSEYSMHFRIGLCERKSGHVSEALERFETIIAAGEIYPPWVASAAGLQAGELYYLSGDTELAESRLRQVLRRENFRGSHEKARELLEKLGR